MRILVVGAGIVGTIYGWALRGAGHEVTHLVRKGRAAPLARGIPIDMLDLRKRHPRRFTGRYEISAVEEAADPAGYGLVVFPGHHYTMPEMLGMVAPRFPDSDFLFLTQNWKGTEEIDAALPASRYVLGDAKAGGTWRGATLVGALKSVDIGPAAPEGEPLARRVIGLFASADIEATYWAEMQRYLWAQFALTAGLWPSLVEAGSFEALLGGKDPSAGERALESVRECLGLLERRGVDLEDYPELRLYRARSKAARFIALCGIRFMFKHSEWARRTSSHALSDPREIRAFYGELRATAAAMGYSMPIFESYGRVIEAFAGEGLHSRP